jgi:hypothetical protein
MSLVFPPEVKPNRDVKYILLGVILGDTTIN